MKKFYYTFGSSSQFPFQNGWIVIEAIDRKEADEIFQEHFPCLKEDVLNCSFVYTEEKWNDMIPEENWYGYKCYGTY